ncbi:hypothetical protein FRB94_014010 [Tulasnella sp. JGI-2019a]|nr:hypothetical protein FRB93_005545 [Tulasnella sp. JGI-2019a]KAG8989789.1 hypothetical protein FRB94_014010 [Tulasnella sp. JGI-2019a]
MDANLRKRKRNVVRLSSTSYAHAGGLNALDAPTTHRPDPGPIRVREAYLLADYPERGAAVETRDISIPDGTSGTSVRGGLISWKLAVGHNCSKSLIDDNSVTDVWGVEGSKEIAGPDKDTDSDDDDDVWVDRCVRDFVFSVYSQDEQNMLWL